MKDIDSIILAVIVVPLLLHVFGLVLLTSSHFDDRNCSLTQKIYLVNLTVAELMTCVLGIVKRIYRDEVHFRWLSLAQFSFYYMMYEALIFMSLDRCMAVYLNIRYPLYWSSRSTLKLIVFSWLLNASLSLVFLLSGTSIRILESMLFAAFDVVFLAVAIPTYVYIYKKIKEKKRQDKRIRPSVIYTSQEMTNTTYTTEIVNNNGSQETENTNSNSNNNNNNNNNNSSSNNDGSTVVKSVTADKKTNTLENSRLQNQDETTWRNNDETMLEYTITPDSIKKASEPENTHVKIEIRGPKSKDKNTVDNNNKDHDKLENRDSGVSNDGSCCENELISKAKKTIKFGDLCMCNPGKNFIAKRKRRRKRRNALVNNKTNNKQFLSIFLLVITFVLFTILPDLVLLCQFVRGVSMETSPLYILYFFSYTCDFFIYTFTVRPVRKTLKKILKVNCC